MPRSFKALLPAKIRTRLEPIARAGRYSHGISLPFGNNSTVVGASGPAPAPTRPVEKGAREGSGLRRPRPGRRQKRRTP
jgi:hypothetical protein